MNPEMFKKKYERDIKGPKTGGPDQEVFDRMITQIDQSLKARKDIKADIPKFIISNVMIIFFSIIAIPCSKWLTVNGKRLRVNG